MVVCSFLAPFFPRLPFAGASDSALRLVPAAAAGLLWEGASLELDFDAACRVDRLVPAILKVRLSWAKRAFGVSDADRLDGVAVFLD